MATHRYYREANTALTESGVLTRPALLLAEGKIIDSEGQSTTYTRELIDSIVASSNEYARTQEIKLFTDHEYSQKARIGSVTGKFTAREIVEIDLAENSDRSSIGKYAIFNDGIEIRDKKAIEKYHSKLLKELSIGIILQKDTGTIFEVSAVPWGACMEAHIYSGEPNVELKQYAFTFDAAKRMGDSPVQYEMYDNHMKAMHAFSMCMSNIENATDKELPKSKDKMKKNAIVDLSAHLTDMHLPQGGQVPDEQDTTPPVITHGKPMTEETKTYSAADFEALQSQLAKVQKDNQDTRKFSALKDRAIALNAQSCKLSTAKYKALFEGDKAFENYQAAIAGDPLEEFLNYVDANITADPRLAPSVYGAIPIPNQEVPERPEFEQKAISDLVDAQAKNLAKSVSYK